MAKRINVKLIMDLSAGGLTQNEIATSRHFSKSSVSLVLKTSKLLDVTAEDLREMSSLDTSSWEIVFELRLNLRRMIRIYADVLVITPERVFPLEFKMKNAVDPDEVLQAAKYVPFLEILFGPGKDIYPALVLTSASELFTEAQIGKTDCLLPVCSGDMLFNVFNEVIGFLG